MPGASMAWKAGSRMIDEQSLPELYAALNRELDLERGTGIEVRRRAHAEPCVAGAEAPAAAMLAGYLPGTPEPVAGTGFSLRVGPAHGASIGIRTELDALPITEATGADFASGNGAMHACGHDVHQGAFVSFLRAASRVELPLGILGIAQPREETYPSGAQDVVRSGLLEHQQVKRALAVHVHPGLPAGRISTGAGGINASADEFLIRITGQGGHGAYPHTAVDPVPVAARTTLALYETLRGTIDPVNTATLTIGQLSAGSAANVIPGHAEIRGTVRAMSTADRAALHSAIQRVAEHQAASAGARAQVSITRGEPVLYNDPMLVEAIDPWIARSGAVLVDPLRSCGADDFSFFTEHVPGAMSFIGVESVAAGLQPPLHSAAFLPPDAAVDQVARLLAAMYVGAVADLRRERGPTGE